MSAVALVRVRCSRRSHVVRVEVRARRVAITSPHDDDSERVLHALGGPLPRCLEVVDDVGALAAKVGRSRLVAWVDAGVLSVSTLQAWRAIGAARPEDVVAWNVLGETRPDAAEQWVEAGILTPAEASEWIVAGVASPLAARRWLAAGVGRADEVARWRRVVRSPEACAKWRRLTAVPEAVATWRAAGVASSDEAARWADAGVTDVDTRQRWLDAGIAAADARRWTHAGIPLDDVPAWRAAGVDDGNDALRWRRAQAATPDDVRGWIAAGVRSQDVAAWHAVGCRNVEDLDCWFAYGFGNDALRWRGVAGVEGALRWRHAGVDEPSELQRWIALRGFVWPGEIALWHKIGPTPMDAARRHASSVPKLIREARREEKLRTGLDGSAFGGVPDEVREVHTIVRREPVLEHRYHYRADGRRVRPAFADFVSTVCFDADGNELPDLARDIWLPRPALPDVVDLHVDCGEETHTLTARRVRRSWIFDSEHDADAERTLLALGGRPPRCAAAAEAFRALVPHMAADRAAAWAETGAVSPRDAHYMYVWKVTERPLVLREVVKREREGGEPVPVGGPFGGHREAREWVAESLDGLLLQAPASLVP